MFRESIKFSQVRVLIMFSGFVSIILCPIVDPVANQRAMTHCLILLVKTTLLSTSGKHGLSSDASLLQRPVHLSPNCNYFSVVSLADGLCGLGLLTSVCMVPIILSK